MGKSIINLSSVTTVGLDLAKHVFQVHCVDASGFVVVAKAIRRNKLLEFFASLPPCLVGLEASGSAHHWARELAPSSDGHHFESPQLHQEVRTNRRDFPGSEITRHFRNLCAENRSLRSVWHVQATFLDASRLKSLAANFRFQGCCLPCAHRARFRTGRPSIAALTARSEFSVVLFAVGNRKIDVIKVIWDIASLDFKEAKDLVEGDRQGRRHRGGGREDQGRAGGGRRDSRGRARRPAR